jgi:hypothetical protein
MFLADSASVLSSVTGAERKTIAGATLYLLSMNFLLLEWVPFICMAGVQYNQLARGWPLLADRLAYEIRLCNGITASPVRHALVTRGSFFNFLSRNAFSFGESV